MDLYDVPLRDRIPFMFDIGDDESVLYTLYYIGSEESAQLTIAASGDHTFLHGDSGSEAADTDTELDAGGVGVIDVSADVTDMHSMAARVNHSTNWRMVLRGALPTQDPEASAGVGIFDPVTTEAVLAAGLDVKTDDTDCLFACAGVTLMGPPSQLHGTDHQVIHVLERVAVTMTYTGAATLKVYACDDDDGSVEEVKVYTAPATTVAGSWPSAGVPAYPPQIFTKGKRLVVMYATATTLTGVSLLAEGFSYIVGPVTRPAKRWVNQLD